MPQHDMRTDPGHPEVAGWVLGALDQYEAGKFREHLESCAGCQAAAAELQPAARMLRMAAPAIQPPADLQDRTLASVARAAGARQAPRTSMWRRWHTGMLSLAAVAASAAGAIFVALQVLQPAVANAVVIPLHARPSVTGSGQAAAQHTANGWSIRLTVHGLKELGHGGFYECWYVGPGDRHGRPDLMIAGQFTVGASGSATVQMWSAANPHVFTSMQITAERSGHALQRGQVILIGSPRRSRA